MSDSGTSKVLVGRLWKTYPWSERYVPMRRMTVTRLLTYPSQPDYVSDMERTRKRSTRAWDYGRIRHFYERLLSGAGETLDAIQVDNQCDFGHVYPVPVLIDGHHRLAAHHLAEAPIVLVNYSGRLDLLRYLTGARKTCPV